MTFNSYQQSNSNWLYYGAEDLNLSIITLHLVLKVIIFFVVLQSPSGWVLLHPG